jgi:NADPH2:quinone reductase
MRVKAIQVSRTGGPEVLVFGEAELKPPGSGEVLVRHTAIGLNFSDVYMRTGLYPPPFLPYTPGVEAAGLVEDVGPGVSFKKGDRVAYGSSSPGAYSEARVLPAAQLVKIPDGIDDKEVAAFLAKGMTAHYLVFSTYRLGPQDTALVHAAAGGVGVILSQWAKHLGARVIGTVGSEAKMAIAKRYGCDEVINYSTEDFVARVQELTRGAKASVVYDSVGEATFLKSLDCLRPMGMMVSFGQSSGPIAPLPVGLLAAKGCLYLARPGLPWHIATREALEARANALFEAMQRKILRCEIARTFALKDAAEAHRALGERKTTGPSVLIP